MSRLTSIQGKLTSKIFNTTKLASTCTLYNLTGSTTYDKWGDASNNYTTGTTTTFVPYNNIDTRMNYQPFGDLQEGEMDSVFPYTTTIVVKDKVLFNSVNYEVKMIERYPFMDGNLALAVRLAKIQ